MNILNSSQSSGDETLAKSIGTVSPEAWAELIAWIDPMKDAREVQAAVSELHRRQRLHPRNPLPLECRLQNQRVAAAYMLMLGARVAALAGVRGTANHASDAAELVAQLVTQVRDQGTVQVQAIVDGTESIATEIIERVGFVPLAELQQLVLLLPVGKPSTPMIALPAGLRWKGMSEVPRAKVTQLLAHTFIETLDCPALNGVRTADDVLDGFLDGRELSDQRHWWAVESNDKLIGCVLVAELPDHATELVYMGLGPTSRGRGIGKLLLDQAILSARTTNSSMLVAAVDSSNWPASRLYTQAGFQEHARVQAWFHNPSQPDA